MVRKFASFAALACVQLLVSNSYAAIPLFRTYLSVDGNDDNPCTLSAPCRLLQAALSATQGGGEVWILDSANYNTSSVLIFHSVSVLAVPGALGSLVADGGDAVDILGNSAMTVTFRNIVFKEIDNANSYNGILVQAANASLIVDGSEFSQLGGGITAESWHSVDIRKSNFYLNSYPVEIGDDAYANSGSTAAIYDSKFQQNGIAAEFEYSTVTLSRNSFSNNQTAISADEGSNILLDNNFIVGNGWGVLGINGAAVYQVFSMSNNTISNNSTDIGATITPVSQL